ncbi:mitochondrial ribonuclease P catalytic subunit isoform X1 [Hydra vulgaris]|uniref:mitochondrial ribonuclease P catalytic subunit isoform X1 n=3 Tax=Hydra vulgaris TaxID=6087 RepID=UPI0006410AF6|nr:mitochondrial ribonuclease P catalytic subunit isoform X1 [Hydra vulgaris]
MVCQHFFSSTLMLLRSLPSKKFYIYPRFFTLISLLRKDRIRVPYKQDTEELLLMKEQKLAEIKELSLTGNKVYTDNLSEQKEYLSMILYQLYIRGDQENLLKVFNEMNASNALAETSYIILMRYYTDCKNLDKVTYLFNVMKNNENNILGTRCYVPLIVCFLKSLHFDSASIYLNEMLETMKKSYNDKLFSEIISICCDLRENYSESTEKIVNQILEFMNCYGIEKVNSETILAIKKWFESDKKNKWFVKPTTINRKNRKCQCCQKQLEPVNLTPERLLKLKQNLMAVVEECLSQIEQSHNIKQVQTPPLTEDMKINKRAKYDDLQIVVPSTKIDKNCNGNFFQNNFGIRSNTLENLKSFLEKNLPFEIIIDSLNMGYQGQQGFEINKVQAVVQYFLDKKKRILLVCADSMNQKYLNSTKTIEKASAIRFRKTMEYLNENCTLYFSESSLVDDYCLLYTIAYHNFELKIVSNDLFRNHLQLMDADTRTAFKRWQLANQMRPLRFLIDDSPIFQPLANYNVTLQQNGDNWHVPISNSVFREKKERSSWLCFQKIDKTVIL